MHGRLEALTVDLIGPWLSTAMAGADTSKVANTIIAAEIVTFCMVVSLCDPRLYCSH